MQRILLKIHLCRIRKTTFTSNYENKDIFVSGRFRGLQRALRGPPVEKRVFNGSDLDETWSLIGRRFRSVSCWRICLCMAWKEGKRIKIYYVFVKSLNQAKSLFLTSSHCIILNLADVYTEITIHASALTFSSTDQSIFKNPCGRNFDF